MHDTVTPPEQVLPDRPPSLLAVRDVRKHFAVRRGLNSSPTPVYAVDGVSFAVGEREVLGLVGESGCGKSTLARVIVGLAKPSDGSVRLRGADVHVDGRRGAVRVGALQMVFQNPAGSLNPRRRIRSSIEEPLRAAGVHDDLHARSSEMLTRVGLALALGDRYPHELSGGQQQRACIARALIARPELVVFDEPISSLDLSVQSQIMSFIKEVQLETTYLFITHDLARAMEISDRIAVMYLGKIVEVLPAAGFLEPLHPYSQALIAAAPYIEPGVDRPAAPPLEGDVPSAMAPPPGCRFHTRCPYAQAVCRTMEPQLVWHDATHQVACHFAAELEAGNQTLRIRAGSRQ